MLASQIRLAMEFCSISETIRSTNSGSFGSRAGVSLGLTLNGSGRICFVRQHRSNILQKGFENHGFATYGMERQPWQEIEPD